MPSPTAPAPDQQRLTTRAIEAEIRRAEEVLKKKPHEKKQTIDQLNGIAKEIVYGAALKRLAERLESLPLNQEEYRLFDLICESLNKKNKLIDKLKEHADKIKAKRAEEVAAVAAEAARVAREAAEKKAAEAAKQAAKPVAKPVAAAAEDEDDDESEVDADEERRPPRVRRLDYSVVTKGDKPISEIFEKFQEVKGAEKYKKEYPNNELDHAIYYALAQIHEEGGEMRVWDDDKLPYKERQSGDGIRPRGQQRRAAYKEIANFLGMDFDSFKDENTGLTKTKEFREKALAKFKERFPDKPVSSLGSALGVSGVAGRQDPKSTVSSGPIVVDRAGVAGGAGGGTVAGVAGMRGGVGASGGAGAGTVAGVVPGGGGAAVGGGGSTAASSSAKQLVGAFGGDTQDLSRKVSPGAGAGGGGSAAVVGGASGGVGAAAAGGGGADLAGAVAHSFVASVEGGVQDVSYKPASVSPPAAVSKKLTSFTALKTPGDGSCLFHAILKGLELGAAKSTILTAEALRAAACDQILQWVEAGDKIHDSYALLQSGDVPLVDKVYVDRMRQTTTYAGELEMLALATKYARPIVVITVPYVSVGESGKDIQMSEIGSIRVTRDETKGGKLEIDKAIFVVYDGKRANDAHYSAVQLPQGVTKQQFYDQLKEAQQVNRQKAGPAASPGK